MLDEIESKTMHKDEEKDQIFFGFFMPMSHGTNETPFKCFPHLHSHPPYQVFTRFVFCFTRNTLSTFF